MSPWETKQYAAELDLDVYYRWDSYIKCFTQKMYVTYVQIANVELMLYIVNIILANH